MWLIENTPRFATHSRIFGEFPRARWGNIYRKKKYADRGEEKGPGGGKRKKQLSYEKEKGGHLKKGGKTGLNSKGKPEIERKTLHGKGPRKRKGKGQGGAPTHPVVQRGLRY